MTSENGMESSAAIELGGRERESELTPCDPHEVEAAVRRELLAEPTMSFSSLVVRRVAEGVCLEGVLESSGDLSEVSDLAKQVAGVETVLNHLVMHDSPPAKG